MILAGILTIFLRLIGFWRTGRIQSGSGLRYFRCSLTPMFNLNQMASIVLQQFRSFTLLAIPLFIFCGKLLQLSDVADDLIYMSRALHRQTAW